MPIIAEFICWFRNRWKNEQTFFMVKVIYRQKVNELDAFQPGNVFCTATAIPIIYSFLGNCVASAPVSTFMCLRAIYMFPGSVHIFPPAEKADPSWIIYDSLTDTWVWELGLSPRHSFSGNLCFKFSNFWHFVFACTELDGAFLTTHTA
jgi:hypothetical protein